MGFVTVCNLVVIEICLVCLLLGWMIVLCAVLVFLQSLIPWRKGWRCVLCCFHFPFPFLSLCVSSVVSASRSRFRKCSFDWQFFLWILVGSCQIASESYVWLLASEVFWIPEACFRVMSCCRLSLLQLRVSPTVSLFSGRGSLLSNFSMCVIAVVCASLGFSGWLFWSFFQSRDFFSSFCFPFLLSGWRVSFHSHPLFLHVGITLFRWCNLRSVSFSSSSSILESCEFFQSIWVVLV